MGSSWSTEEEKGSSSQQVHHQPVYHSDSEAVVARPSQNPGLHTPLISKNNSHYHHVNEPNNKELAKRVQLKLPHNFEAIIKDINSDSPVDRSSSEKLYEQLHVGVFLNGRMKKYWVDKKGNNCFMVFADGLKITWAENPTHWYLHTTQTSDHGNITIAQLRNVAWLEVHGRLHTTNFTPGVTYQVAFLIMLEYASYGWDVPVNFRLTLPNGNKQEHKENFNEKPKGEWLRIPAGEFKVSSPENVGEIEFSLYEYEGGSWKKGLIVKSAIIEPKY